MLEQLMTSCSVFPEEICWLYEVRPALCCARKSLAVEGGSRLHEPEGQTEFTPSMATRGDQKLGANGYRGASWSEERLVAA